MKVSIIIPVYKVEPFIERCLQSALGQTYPDIEVIVVDDCSPDRSALLARQVIEKHPRGSVARILHHEQNQGLSVARNTGIEAATGDYFFFLDSDDYISPDAIELLVRQAEECDADFVVGNFEVEGEARSVKDLGMPTGVIRGTDNIINALRCEWWYVMAWNKLVKASLLRRCQLLFEPGIVYEDSLWSFRLATHAQVMAAIDAPTYHYLIRPDAITGQGLTMYHYDCRKKIVKLLYQYITANPQLQRTTVIRLFERFKFLYMRVLMASELDPSLRRDLYATIRACRMGGDLHYRLPFAMGLALYKSAVWIDYKFLLLKIKLGLAKC